MKEEKKAESGSDEDEKGSSDSEAEEDVGELPVVSKTSMNEKPKARISVSAEVFGRYNIKGAFVPTVIEKSAEVKERIHMRL